MTWCNDYVTGVANGAGSVVAGKGWNWYAIASTSVVNANANALVSAPVYRVDNVRVAAGYNGMWEAGGTGEKHENPININEKLGEQECAVFAATSFGGTANRGQDNPVASGSDWRSRGGRSGAGAGNREWIDHTDLSALGAHSFYALSEPLTIAVPEPATMAP